MKKFFTQLLLLSPLVMGLVATNYLVDPANLFHAGELENTIADNLVRGYNVTDITNYNERLLQRYVIGKSDHCPSTVAIGASRIMTLGQSATGDSSFRNNGLNSATLEDYLAIVELYEERGCQLRKIIIDLEPYLLNDSHGQGQWVSLDREFNAMMHKLSSPTDVGVVAPMEIKARRFLELFSPSYFKNSVDYAISTPGKASSPTHEVFNAGRTVLVDGSLTYGADENAVGPGIVEERVQYVITSNNVHAMSDFHELSPRYTGMFEKFIDHLQQHHVEVEFRLFPYAPSLFSFFERTEYYHIVARTEEYFRAVATRKGIPVIGSYDPKTFELTNSSFQDGYHLKRAELEKVSRSTE